MYSTQYKTCQPPVPKPKSAVNLSYVKNVLYAFCTLITVTGKTQSLEAQ